VFEPLGACDSYVWGEATIRIPLPRKAASCQYCPFISTHAPYDRYYCKITNEWLLNWKRERGELCLFIFESEGKQ
jgi:hypothetical protein